MTIASPAKTVSRSGRCRAQCPSVWPGVGTTTGFPGTGRVLAVAVADDLADRRRPERAVAQERGHDRQRLDLRREVRRAGAFVVVAPGMPGERDVVLVDVDRHAQLAAGALGEPDVVEVGVGEDDGAHLAEPVADRLEQRGPRAWDAAVDDRDAVVGLEHIPVREIVHDPVDAGSDVAEDHVGALPRIVAKFSAAVADATARPARNSPGCVAPEHERTFTTRPARPFAPRAGHRSGRRRRGAGRSAATLGTVARGAFAGPRLHVLLRGDWLGHALHPVSSDVVVGTLLSASLLDFVGGDPDGRARRRLIAAAVGAATPTALTGLNDWAEEEETDAGVRRAGVVHALSNATALLLYAGSLTGGRARGVALRVSGAAALGAGPYLGGHLSFVKGVGVDAA